MTTLKLVLYVNLFLTAVSPQTGLLQHGNKQIKGEEYTCLPLAGSLGCINSLK